MSQTLHPEGTLSPSSLQSLFRFEDADHRLVLWAQRSSETEEVKNIVYLSVNAIDLQHPKVDLTETGVTVEGVQKGTNAVYKAVLEFYEPIDVQVRAMAVNLVGWELIPGIKVSFHGPWRCLYPSQVVKET